MLVCLFTQMETNDKKLILKDSIFIMNLFGTFKKKKFNQLFSTSIKHVKWLFQILGLLIEVMYFLCNIIS